MRDLHAEPPLRLDRAIKERERTRLLGRVSAWPERESVALLLSSRLIASVNLALSRYELFRTRLKS